MKKSGDSVVRLMASGRRWCYTIVATQDPEEYGGYVPSLVVEGERGHWPMVGREDQAPWVWGDSLSKAQAVCLEYNAKRGLTQEDELRIVASTL